ncbi:ArsA family ATPase [Paenalcaligenes sp. Me52]|uniref:ArsA family ATPase n=1 Tax=Paenalcaligenes sp. Me52 TaxID=3392038 RepID=UPI003D2685CF
MLNIEELLATRRLILLGGKGGVGKTTMSSALAVLAASTGRKVLLVSTDPAHSLSDAFGRSIGDHITMLAPQLWALEIDPDKEADAYLERVLAQMRRYAGPDQINELQRHLQLSRQSPGAQEAALLERLAKVIEDGLQNYDTVILDTAPTGHTLRLLSLPEVMAAWTDGLLRHNKRSQHLSSVLKHLTPSRSIDSLTGDPNQHHSADLDDKDAELLNTLLRRQQLFNRTRRLLHDIEHTAFVFVLTPERLPILETERAVQALMSQDIPVAGLIVNRLLPPMDDSNFWAHRRQQQEKHMLDLHHRLPTLRRCLVSLQADDIVGLESLQMLGNHLISSSVGVTD